MNEEHSSEEPVCAGEPCIQCDQPIGDERHGILWGPCDECGTEHAKGFIHYHICADAWENGEDLERTLNRRAGALGLN